MSDMDEGALGIMLAGALDELAAIEHERWAHWQRYVHGKGERLPDGRIILPADEVARWDRQIATAFADLTEKERESDRDQVRRYLPVIAAALAGWRSEAGSVARPEALEGEDS